MCPRVLGVRSMSSLEMTRDDRIEQGSDSSEGGGGGARSFCNHVDSFSMMNWLGLSCSGGNWSQGEKAIWAHWTWGRVCPLDKISIGIFIWAMMYFFSMVGVSETLIYIEYNFYVNLWGILFIMVLIRVCCNTCFHGINNIYRLSIW